MPQRSRLRNPAAMGLLFLAILPKIAKALSAYASFQKSSASRFASRVDFVRRSARYGASL